MSIDIKAPSFPESISEGTVAGWLKAAGDRVRRDEVLVEIETDKVVLEVVAPEDGVLTEIIAATGETVQSEQIIGRFTAGQATGAQASPPAPASAEGRREERSKGQMFARVSRSDICARLSASGVL